ncbi:MAG: hypothetical protein HY567_02600 [Candidatus Kerfeldbacteria bacterium]|nr:hypothetical protein [Candidatus Kerfeldbacteria bacterium]
MIGRHSGIIGKPPTQPDTWMSQARKWTRHGSVLAKPEITKAMREGWIVVYPEKYVLEDNCIALQLHEVFWRQDPGGFRKEYSTLNPGNLDQIKLLWKLDRALTYDEMMERYPKERIVTKPWPESTKFIYVKPHEQILACTDVVLGVYGIMVGYFVTKSCPARQGGQTVACSNEVRVNTTNRPVLELSNRLEMPVIFPIGPPITTVTFELLTSPILPKSTPDAAQICGKWTPESMLRAYLG